MSSQVEQDRTRGQMEKEHAEQMGQARQLEAKEHGDSDTSAKLKGKLEEFKESAKGESWDKAQTMAGDAGPQPKNQHKVSPLSKAYFLHSHLTWTFCDLPPFILLCRRLPPGQGGDGERFPPAVVRQGRQ